MRLISRGDADGLACAVFITTMEKIESIKFAHPKDMQDGKIDVTQNDIICNLPFHPDCYMWFDHHISEETRQDKVISGDYKAKFGLAPSAARLDKSDVTNPVDWMLLLMSLDPRSSLGDFEYYFFELVDWIKKYSLAEIMKQSEAQLRCDYVLSEKDKFKDALMQCTKMDGNVIAIDFRDLEVIPMGNRFYEYILFPDGNISIRIFWGKDKKKVICASGHNIFKRDSNTNIGLLFKKYGGGGHAGAGTCQLDAADADRQLKEIIEKFKIKKPV